MIIYNRKPTNFRPLDYQARLGPIFQYIIREYNAFYAVSCANTPNIFSAVWEIFQQKFIPRNTDILQQAIEADNIIMLAKRTFKFII